MNFPKYWAHGRFGNFTAWRWSNTSHEEAENAARHAAQHLSEAVRDNRHLDRYAYADRPLREPVLQELRNSGGELSAVVTRNSYGCQVLNAARAMFVDVDFPEAPAPQKSGGVFGSLFGRKAAPEPVDPVQPAIAKAEDWAKNHSGWNWRIYRTQAGLRLLATHALFDPADGVCQAVFDSMGADPLYRKLCATQECFRARLTPKPWRCGMKNPPARWPFESLSAELAFKNWEEGYQSASRTKASCKLMSEGTGVVHPDLQPLVRLHDEMTRATSPLLLA